MYIPFKSHNLEINKQVKLSAKTIVLKNHVFC